MSSKKLAKATIGLMIMTMLAKVLGFLRETVLVNLYGASMISDVYLISFNIPQVLISTVGTAIVTTFIPLFIEIENNKNEKEALKFANNIFNIVIIISVILSILGFIFARPLTNLFAIEFSGEKLNLATKFTQIMIWSMVFISISNVMTSWLQIRGKFNITGMITMPSNIVIILFLILSSLTGNTNLMSIGTVLGLSTLFFFQYPSARKTGFRYIPYINVKDEYIKRMLLLIVPVLISVSVNQINLVVDRSLASTLGDGIITILNSANKLNMFVQGLFITTITSVIYPMLSELSAKGDEKEFSNAIKGSVNIVQLLIIPISVGAIVLAEPVVKLVFERGNFTTHDTALTASALVGYSIGMIGYSLRDVMNRIFYSLKDTKTPMYNGIFTVIMNVGLNFMLIKPLGHVGPALATSIASIVCTGYMFISLKKRVTYFGQDKIIKTSIKSIVAAILMGFGTKLIYNGLSNYIGVGLIKEIITLGVSVVGGVVIYGVMVVLLKVEEIGVVKESVNKIIFKKKNKKLE